MSIRTVSWFSHSKGRRFIIPGDAGPHPHFAQVMDADRCLDQHQCVRYCLGVKSETPSSENRQPIAVGPVGIPDALSSSHHERKAG